MKTFFVFALLTVGMTSASLLSPVKQLVGSVVSLVDSILQIEKTPILGSGNTGCSHNPKCTEYELRGTAYMVQILQRDRSDVTPRTPDRLKPVDIAVNHPPRYNINLTKGICTTKISSTTRRDSSQKSLDNFKFEMSVDFVQASDHFDTRFFGLRSVIGPCVIGPGVFNTIFPFVPPSHYLAQCLKNTSDLSIGTNATGYLSVAISGLLIEADYTAHKKSRWIANWARMETDQMVITNKTCNGSPLFNVVCKCLLETDEFIKSVYYTPDPFYTCHYQNILDHLAYGYLKCPYF